MRHSISACLLTLAVLLVAPSPLPVSAGETQTLRIATLAPRGSSGFKTLEQWGKRLTKETGGRVKMQLFPGGVAGDERDVIRKMKLGQIDASGLTSVGLGQIYRPILVLQMPGLFESPEELHAVRAAMTKEWSQKLSERGYVLLGWFDAGFGRIFSKRPIERPSDYKHVRPWVWRDDPMFPAFLEIVGANGVALGLPEVLAALSTGMIDTVTASAVAAVGLQWFRYVTHMSEEAGVAIVGASLITRKKLDALPKDVQERLLASSPAAHAALNRQAFKEDARAEKVLIERGMKVFSIAQHEDEWVEAMLALRDRLVGRLFSAAELERVWTLAKQARAERARARATASP